MEGAIQRTLPGLEKVLLDLQRADPGWFALAGCDALVACSLLNEEAGFSLDSSSLASGGFEMGIADLDPMLGACELSAAHFLDLALICFERIDETEQLLWPKRDGPRGTYILQILSANLGNTLLAIRELTIAGFDVQARVLFRSFVEVADATVACAYDFEFFYSLQLPIQILTRHFGIGRSILNRAMFARFWVVWASMLDGLRTCALLRWRCGAIHIVGYPIGRTFILWAFHFPDRYFEPMREVG